MIWGCFSSKATAELLVIHGRMNGSMYREILVMNRQKSATSLGHGRNFMLQHNNDPKHTTKLTKGWFENNGISTLNWPSQSPDLNPIDCPVSWGCRIHWLHLCRGVRPPTPPNECPGYDTKQSDDEVPAVLELWGMRSTPLLPSLPGPLWPGVVAPDRALSMG